MKNIVRLYAPPEFWQLTPAEKEKRCNGCGPKGYGLFIPDTIWGLRITPACDIHDFMYALGETEADKCEADRVFLNNMIRLIDAAGSWSIVRWLRQRRAMTYYQAVHELGGPAFWSGKNPRSHEGMILMGAK